MGALWVWPNRILVNYYSKAGDGVVYNYTSHEQATARRKHNNRWGEEAGLMRSWRVRSAEVATACTARGVVSSGKLQLRVHVRGQWDHWWPRETVGNLSAL